MVIGRRIDVPWTANKSLFLPDDVNNESTKGKPITTYAEDFFFIARNAFPWRRVYGDLVIGRPGYDNFVVATAIRNNVSVVDATLTLPAIHQSDQEGNRAGWQHTDSGRNWRRIGKFNYAHGSPSCAPYETRFDESDGSIRVLQRKFSVLPKVCYNVTAARSIQFDRTLRPELGISRI